MRCVVFDVDDTLYLERDYVRSGFRHVGEWVRNDLGLEGFADLAWRAFEEGVRGSIFDLALQRCGVDPRPDLVNQLVDLYRAHSPALELCPDAKVCLDRLRGRVPLAAISDGPLASQRQKVRALGLDEWLDPVLLTAELGPGFDKPNVGAYRLVEERTGCAGSECVYVADNPAKDFMGPKSLGWSTIRVRRPGSLHQAVGSTDEVDLEVPDLHGLDVETSKTAPPYVAGSR
jgi:putative hydrolase of the HAD superfamily